MNSDDGWMPEELELPRHVRRMSSAVQKHPNLRLCKLCGRKYCIIPDGHEISITIERHLARCHADESEIADAD